MGIIFYLVCILKQGGGFLENILYSLRLIKKFFELLIEKDRLILKVDI